MATLSEQRFAQLLTEGVYRIRLSASKTIQIVQEELGAALGRNGGSAIEYWRKGHLPPRLSDIETLAREIVRRGHMEREWVEQFLRSARHPAPAELCDELFPAHGSGVTQPARATSADRRPRDGQPAADSARNPFIVGPPVIQPQQFFGRAAELRYIFELWQHFPLQHVVVLGLRRSGKTSLLHHLRQIPTAAAHQVRPGQRTEWLPHPQRFRWAFVDFQDARMCSRDRLLRHLLTSLNLPVPDPCDLYHFMDVVIQHLRSPAVILMDELGAALACRGLDQQFWGSLRSLGSHHTNGNLGFLLTSQAEPAQLAGQHDHTSPFFNIFGHTLQLGPLREPEARDLIASSPRPFDPADADWIATQSGRWPCLVQMLCHLRLTTLDSGETGDEWKAEGLRRIAPYRYLLNDR